MQFHCVEYLAVADDGRSAVVGLASLIATDEGEAERRVVARLRERFPLSPSILVCCFPLIDA